MEAHVVIGDTHVIITHSNLPDMPDQHVAVALNTLSGACERAIILNENEAIGLLADFLSHDGPTALFAEKFKGRDFRPNG